jgi:hypothetical protein
MARIGVAMKLVLTSGSVLWNKGAGAPYPGTVEAVETISAAGNLVGLVSMHGKPSWLAPHFPNVQFVAVDGRHRKTGDVPRKLLLSNQKVGLKPSHKEGSNAVARAYINLLFVIGVGLIVLFVAVWASDVTFPRSMGSGMLLCMALAFWIAIGNGLLVVGQMSRIPLVFRPNVVRARSQNSFITSSSALLGVELGYQPQIFASRKTSVA